MNEVSTAYRQIQAQMPHRTTLVAVSKKRSKHEIEALYAQGQRDFGENRVLELVEKARELERSCPERKWHFIGNLQSNKVKELLTVPNLVAIHSIDRDKLIRELFKHKPNHPILCFLQVNTSGENEKSGFKNLDEINAAAKLFEGQESFILHGLMTMGGIRTENFEQTAHKCFKKLKEIRDELNPELKLSMGMSADYKIALEYGADYLRLGRILFEGDQSGN